MNLKSTKRILLILMAVYWLFAIGIYAIANEQFKYSAITGEAPGAELVIGEVIDNRVIHQNVAAPAELISNVEVLAGTYERANTGTLHIDLMDAGQNIITQTAIPVSQLQNNTYTAIALDRQYEVVRGEVLTLRLYTEGCSNGNAVTVFAGRSGQYPYAISNEEPLGTLCIRLNGYHPLSFYKTYWIIVAAAFLVFALYAVQGLRKTRQGKTNFLMSLLTVYTRYSFLIKQLISRDFKTKYKRSALGMAWSILNPLLTMSIQYFVFSTLFKSDIPNYPVYLLTGIVFFNFFHEALTLGMTSITANATLIKKVYMPKYIYPVSRILSSLVNFALALIPLLLVMLMTGTPFRPSILLLSFDILCFLAFIMGMTLLLASAMTFFQDTQFLWNIVSMMWQYLTPVFYPETIIPQNILPFYRLNPLYQFITFARTCIIDGVSPAPGAYLGCLASALLFLLLGIAVFRRYQNKFVLYL